MYYFLIGIKNKISVFNLMWTMYNLKNFITFMKKVLINKGCLYICGLLRRKQLRRLRYWNAKYFTYYNLITLPHGFFTNFKFMKQKVNKLFPDICFFSNYSSSVLFLHELRLLNLPGGVLIDSNCPIENNLFQLFLICSNETTLKVQLFLLKLLRKTIYKIRFLRRLFFINNCIINLLHLYE